MPSRIEDYALIGDCHTAALVGKDGSIDWLCVPRFDSDSCFAALLGKPEDGRWLLAPAVEVREVRRRYRPGTLVLETDFETDEGAVRLIDAMPLRDERPVVIRVVEGLRGRCPIRMDLVVRADYGRTIPWVRRTDGGLSAIAGPNMIWVRSEVEIRGEHYRSAADFEVAEGQRIPFTLTSERSYHPEPPPVDPWELIRQTERRWREWSDRCRGDETEYGELVRRSAITLKALTYAPTGGIVAAATTSLPERIGGVRNWDYRLCWIRDATFTLLAMIAAGYHDEAAAWREWLLRAVAGKASQLQIMYGLAGERRLDELELGWLDGFEGSRPVRIGNAASGQFQLDVFGELIDAMFQSRVAGVPPDRHAWDLEREMLDYLETIWKEPDEGIWEVRGPRRHFTHSKVMAWVAFDRAVKSVERLGVEGPAERWAQVRDAIHEEVCQKGFNPRVGAFVQYYGSDDLDASLLMIPLVGFLPAVDPRVRQTVEAIERGLLKDGFVQRYQNAREVDGLPPGEGAFLPCSFWLADSLALLGRRDEARRLFERLVGLCNDVGLISEEYDPAARRLLGNFPQAFTHVSLINTAFNLAAGQGPADHRGQG